MGAIGMLTLEQVPDDICLYICMFVYACLYII